MDPRKYKYLGHFGLKRKPFETDGDSNAAWLENWYQAVRVDIMRRLDEQNGFVILVGAEDFAKTAVVDQLARDLTSKTVSVTIPETQLEVLDFFKLLADAFQFKKPVISKGGFFLQLRDQVTADPGADGHAVLILNEAHRLAPDLLEALCQLSDAKIQDRRLLSFLLIGRAELIEMVSDASNPNLAERVSDRINLQALNNEETRIYVQECMQAAGAVNTVFDKSAEKEVFRFSRGRLWLIDSLCEMALILGFQQNRRIIDNQIIGECAVQLGLPGKRDFDREAFLKYARDIREQVVLLAMANAAPDHAAVEPSQTIASEYDAEDEAPFRLDAGPEKPFQLDAQAERRAQLAQPARPAKQKKSHRPVENRILYEPWSDGEWAIPKTAGTGVLRRKRRSPIITLFYTMLSLGILVAIGYGMMLHVYGEKMPGFGIDELIQQSKKIDEMLRRGEKTDADLEEIDPKASNRAPADSSAVQGATGTESEPLPEAEMVIGQRMSIYFKDKFNELQPEHLVVLQQLADHLARNPQITVTLRGFSNTPASPEHNLNVSRFQVNIIKSFLIGKGVPVDNIRSLVLGNASDVAADPLIEPFQSRKVVIELSEIDGNSKNGLPQKAG